MTPKMDQNMVQYLRRVYDLFNARDMDAVLAAMDANVTWANGMEGGYVHGRDGVRAYWTRQWSLVDPRVEPLEFSAGDDGGVIVHAHTEVRDRDGNVLSDRMVDHVFRIRDGLITRFDIRDA